ncbi:hypothetical protein [Thalassobacillus sp. CUG 92003]|uniref:hypothetical protein n=1 Tax=Thalassobacillus sp. CUG 92003 TaxID=2736641 RepID=UPI0015E65B83|nr:hypothetical protein [Thalassobacillus sp. CUG 92003]
MKSILAVMLSVGAYVLYRNRYHWSNALLSQPVLRKQAIRIAMKIPFVRKRMVGGLFSARS